MRITKFGHACVRIEHEGRVLVLDPGAFTDAAADALDGAHAVLLTHEHPDHYLVDHLRRTDAPIWTIGAVAARIREEAPDVAERVTVVAPGERLEAAGLPVRVVGERHAVIHPELPRFDNSGYVVTCGDERVYHPGDALTEPGEPVDVLCAPVSAPWLKASEAVDFARAVAAPRTLAIHDRVYSELGLGVIDQHMGAFLPDLGIAYSRIPEGADLPAL
ncbi:MBL fold metallo-hydrolase [Nocardioides sp. TRM66260-LWL]|uniref:MBL fold metallo-hydrolase n=1 Tax=Nocardioides sp. TRM66260-LWL TaxID=2874478 RepID=UPI001CC6C0BD|nr:MBL fold metallo-hydrolase [Nocardioides sp. TRM66260-LWL]MBZ5735672.1 MBL fold metallo-hydrolase [Nocardioides sp. TRM66260-LWL]